MAEPIAAAAIAPRKPAHILGATAVLAAALAVAPFVGIYPVFLMKAL